MSFPRLPAKALAQAGMRESRKYMTDITKTITTLKSGQTLSEAEAFDLQAAILAGEVSTPILLEIFSTLQNRAVTKAELTGFFKASQSAMTALPSSVETLDTCGTGGDNSGSFNISTVAALVCATAGVPVAKHGNRAASSKCGSADVLEALGVQIDLIPQLAKRVLEKTGFVFLFARDFHPAFKYAAEARKAFGKKTYFNLLGPLLNPAKALYRVHGLSDFSFAETLGDLLIDSGVKRVWLLHAEDGLDEISPASVTKVIEREKGKPARAFLIDPQKLNLAHGNRDELKGGNAKINAEILTNILQGRGTSAQNAAVILNAAAGLTVYGKAKSFEEGVKLASETLVSGKSYKKLQEIITVSKAV